MRFEPSGSNSLSCRTRRSLPWSAQRHVADFVEKERAAVRQFELADAPLAIRAGVGARRRAEEFDFEQRLGNRRDVHRHERLRGARRGAVDRVGEQFLAGAGFAEQQHRRLDLRGAARLTLHFEARRARADEARERVLGAPRLRERLARRDQFLLHARVMREERRERLHLVEERKADRADRLAAVVLERQPRDDERLAVGFEHVEQDRLAGHHDFAHQAVRDHGFAVAADRLLRVRKAETRRITLVDPDDARIRIHDESAFAQILEGLEKRFHRAPQYVAVVGGNLGPVVHHASTVSPDRRCTCLFIETEYLIMETPRNALFML